ncbi:MAG: RnfABCDGE type electron transport complex subunit G [Candidatus Omnitrophica bacterium]|nr:RnfABCDGE type electron transport complex subunit G [Candidatus Omnitrophota bacterium]
MKEMIRYGLILASICVIASASLAAVNSVTKTRILSQAKSEEEAGLKEVVPEGARFDAVKSGNETIYYKAFDKNGMAAGVAFKAEGKGYSSVIETLAGMKNDGTIIAVKILNHNETPGLGARVAEHSFTGQFANKNIRDLNQVQAITGATISSKAVMDSVKKKAEEIKNLLKD